jgi:Phage tail lysozyme
LAGTRRNGTSKLGPFNRSLSGHRTSGHPARSGGGRGGYSAPFGRTSLVGSASFGGSVALAGGSAALDFGAAPLGRYLDYAGRHASHRSTTARPRGGKAVPAAAVAATLAVGAVAYTLAGGHLVGHAPAAGLNAAIALSGPSSGTLSTGASSTGASSANEAAAAIGQVATATASVPRSAHAYVPRHAKPAVKAAVKAAATPTAAASSAAAAPRASAAATPSATAKPAPSTAPSHAAAATLSCSTDESLLPENVTAIVSFLLKHGYSDNAAAGIAGNIYQESSGNPEAVGDGGGGLIGWTPLPSGYITGDVSADLETQLAGVLTYDQEWSSYLSALNSAATPADAAYIYVTDFERAGIPAAATRESSAANVASACRI